MKGCISEARNEARLGDRYALRPEILTAEIFIATNASCDRWDA
jgi:hypothetical protein